MEMERALVVLNPFKIGRVLHALNFVIKILEAKVVSETGRLFIEVY